VSERLLIGLIRNHLVNVVAVLAAGLGILVVRDEEVKWCINLATD
jgi:hypothetical protein